MLGCMYIIYEELNMIHIVGYLTVNMYMYMLFTVLHSIAKSIAFYE